MLESGALIAGRYRLVAPLASGGMGAVWRAEHTELASEVALKLMLEPAARTGSAEKRFRREARAAARLKSPHVVKVLDFGVHEGQPYLAMELLRGEDLAARIADRGPLPLETCAGILDGVAKAIDLAHEHGIIHRDLKPANIFLAKEDGAEIVKVLDFGIAKLETPDGEGARSTTGAAVVGSPAYMSPEQVWGEKVTPKSDLWSMAVVALEVVTGSNPFAGGPLARVFQKIVRDELPRPSALSPGLPASTDAFFRRALERDPEKRFANAAELAAEFRRAIADAAGPHDETVDAARRPSTAPAARSPRRLSAAGIGVAITAAGSLVFVLSRAPSRGDSSAPSAPAALDPSAAPATSSAPSATPETEVRDAPAPSAKVPPEASARSVEPSDRAARPVTPAPARGGPPVVVAVSASAAPPVASVDEVFGIPKSR